MKNNTIFLVILLWLSVISALRADDLSATVFNQSGSNTFDGKILLTLSGGIPPYSFSWSGSNGFSSFSKDIYNLGAGFYSVTVSDAMCGKAILENLEVKSSTQPCGYVFGCKGVQTTSESPIFTRNQPEQCQINHVCSATGQTIYSEQGIATWQTDPFCGCCQQILVCSMSGATLGYQGCSMHLAWEYNILCCEYTIWLVCDCTGQRGFYMINRGSGCGPDPSCFSPNPDDFKNTTIDKNKEYIYYLDPKTKEKYAFTFDEIASKKYKVNYPDMPDLDLNQKVTFDNKNMTIYDVLKPKRFLFSVNPNPFEGSPNISLFISKIGENDKGILKVTDALGRILLTQELDNLHEGENLIMPNLSNFNSGIYFITIQVNDKIETKKVYKK